ncbi:MAG: hypothetical protein JO319_12935 [Acidobacteriaceae bacterium]|nr:hypothetical protein [Acidobacteriaceae bacterium]
MKEVLVVTGTTPEVKQNPKKIFYVGIASLLLVALVAAWLLGVGRKAKQEVA